MWRPGFDYQEKCEALLYGYHRRFCVLSLYHRGCTENPGLVFGLDLGGACRGVAFRVARKNAAQVKAYLQAREQVTQVYQDVIRTVHLPDRGLKVAALCFVVDRTHAQYARGLSVRKQAALIVQGRGRSGSNLEYFCETLAHLRGSGIRDRHLEALWCAVARRLP